MEILRYVAFSDDPNGGNPAGVVIDADELDDAAMQEIAADIGFAETAFLVRDRAQNGRAVNARYFSPLAEVPFCGHATIASGVALAERFGAGIFELRTPVGPVQLETLNDGDGLAAQFTSVPPQVGPLPDGSLPRLLDALRLSADDLDPGLPPLDSMAGSHHPIIGLKSRVTFDALDYDFDELRSVMEEYGWLATVNVVHRISPLRFASRNPFPPGGIREDPATGSAAAALGAYLRHLGELDLPATFTVHQGEHIGRPGILTVTVPATGGITVRGAAVELP